MSIDAKNVDWKHINGLVFLEIYEAVAVSLGYELDSLSVIPTYPELNKHIICAPEQRERTIHTYEWAKGGRIKLENPNAFDGPLEEDSKFFHGQFVQVELLDFRKFCDCMEWDVPQEFRPLGYKFEDKDTAAKRVERTGELFAARKNCVDQFGSVAVLSLSAQTIKNGAGKNGRGEWSDEAKTLMKEASDEGKTNGLKIADVAETFGLTRQAFSQLLSRKGKRTRSK